METDKALSAIPRRYLPACVQCAIAPAMKVDGTKTFWGQEVEDDEKAEVKKMLGIDLSLHMPGDNAKKTEEREAAVEIIERMNDQRKKARQTMLSHKGAHGIGINPDFPTREDLETKMEGHPYEFMV